MSARSLLALIAVCANACAAGELGLHKQAGPPAGCTYEGRWYVEGAGVRTREACLRCACAGGALACSRRACAQLPDPPPPRCHVRHRKDACCPELHCPHGVITMEHGASARFEMDDFSDVSSSGTHGKSCVEGGTVYAAGSAMTSGVACEQCFCLGGRRRCVRPQCLLPPPGCSARPPPGACCPQRYYCNHTGSTKPPGHRGHDCFYEGTQVYEGERVVLAEAASNCTQCFCLRGSVRCQPLACAPPLLGCEPLLRPGQCCAHQYHCRHNPDIDLIGENKIMWIKSLLLTHNALPINEDRSFHGKTSKAETSTEITSSKVTDDNRSTDTIANTNTNTITTSKVKRKTNDGPYMTSTSRKNFETHKYEKLKQTSIPETTAVMIEDETTTEPIKETEDFSTEQPEETVKIMVNGTINCTTEFSSNSLPINVSLEDVEKINAQSIPRVPSIDRMDGEPHTFDPNDIVTDKTKHSGYDDNETFTINVTSSLRHNNSVPIPGTVISVPKVPPPQDLSTLNVSKKAKDDYDYDYAEPTLPPSLPNLKIIPFVAADAVVEDDPPVKEVPNYPLERDDKYPIYYPKPQNNTPFASRREDVQYPVFTLDKVESRYPTSEEDISGPGYHGISDLAASLHEYTVSASLGSHLHDLAKPSQNIHKINQQTPSVNLFSPPVETEGGFIPKSTGLIDEYYAVYPSTPPGPQIPHLTTSMQLDTAKDCTLGDGRQVSEGDTISLACSICTCGWGELHCSPRPCHTPTGCKRIPASISTSDLCCGELVCGLETTSSTTTTSTTQLPYMTTLTENYPSKTDEEGDYDEDEANDADEASSAAAPETTEAPAKSDTSYKTTYDGTIKTENKSVPVEYSTKTVPNNIEKEYNSSSNANSILLESEFSTTKYKNNATDPLSTTTPVTLTTHKINPVEAVEESNNSQEYEEEEDDDEGFSFGSVLKLLLSETYGTSTEPPIKKLPSTTTTTTTTTTPETKNKAVAETKPQEKIETTTAKLFTKPKLAPTTNKVIPTASRPTSTTSRPVPSTSRPVPTTSRTVPSVTTRKTFTKPTVSVFIPLPPQNQVYAPPKNFYSPTSVNRVDHLVLGEATAIKKTTSRPASTFRPVSTPYKHSPISRPATTRQPYTTRKPEVTKSDVIDSTQYTSVTHERPRPPGAPPLPSQSLPGPGLLKLAGCNIYGRMYRVGRIITELSTPCQECRCTELGVQCRDLAC